MVAMCVCVLGYGLLVGVVFGFWEVWGVWCGDQD